MFGSKFFPHTEFLNNNLQLNRVAVQSIVTGVLTNVLWDVPTIIDSSTYTYNVGTGVVTFLKTGWYQFSFTPFWGASALGVRYTNINLIDGTTRNYENNGGTALLTNGQIVVSPLILIKNIGSTVRLQVIQTTGANLNLGGNNNLECNISRMSDL